MLGSVTRGIRWSKGEIPPGILVLGVVSEGEGRGMFDWVDPGFNITGVLMGWGMVGPKGSGNGLCGMDYGLFWVIKIKGPDLVCIITRTRFAIF